VRIINQNEQTLKLVSVTTDAGTVVMAGTGAVPFVVRAGSGHVVAAGVAVGIGLAVGIRLAVGVGQPQRVAVGVRVAVGAGLAHGLAVADRPPVNRQISVEIKSREMAILDPTGQRYLQITGLGEELRPGQTVVLTFRFDNGVEIETPGSDRAAALAAAAQPAGIRRPRVTFRLTFCHTPRLPSRG
jgi:hypothetical protein